MAKTEMTGYIHWIEIREEILRITTSDGKDHIVPFDKGPNADNYRRWVGFTSRDAKLVLEDGEVKDMQPVEEPAPPTPAAPTPPAQPAVAHTPPHTPPHTPRGR